LIKAERKDEARTLLKQLTTSTTATQAHLMVAVLDGQSSNRDEARQALLNAIYSDGSGLSISLGYRYQDPRAALAQLYVADGQLNAALAFNPVQLGSVNNVSGEGEGGDDYTEYDVRSFNYKTIGQVTDQAKYLTLQEEATERVRVTQRSLYGALTDLAIKKGELASAIGLLDGYLTILTSPDEIAATTQKITQLQAQYYGSRAGGNNGVTLLRLDRANTESALSRELQISGF
jgi:hypothetical protein